MSFFVVKIQICKKNLTLYKKKLSNKIKIFLCTKTNILQIQNSKNFYFKSCQKINSASPKPVNV